jgi:hypothetical protein
MDTLDTIGVFLFQDTKKPLTVNVSGVANKR